MSEPSLITVHFWSHLLLPKWSEVHLRCFVAVRGWERGSKITHLSPSDTACHVLPLSLSYVWMGPTTDVCETCCLVNFVLCIISVHQKVPTGDHRVWGFQEPYAMRCRCWVGEPVSEQCAVHTCSPAFLLLRQGRHGKDVMTSSDSGLICTVHFVLQWLLDSACFRNSLPELLLAKKRWWYFNRMYARVQLSRLGVPGVALSHHLDCGTTNFGCILLRRTDACIPAECTDLLTRARWSRSTSVVGAHHAHP